MCPENVVLTVAMLGSQREVEGAVKGLSQMAPEAGMRSFWVEEVQEEEEEEEE